MDSEQLSRALELFQNKLKSMKKEGYTQVQIKETKEAISSLRTIWLKSLVGLEVKKITPILYKNKKWEVIDRDDNKKYF